MENEARHRRAKGEIVATESHHPYTLTRCVGQPGTLEIDLIEHDLLPGDHWLFVSDGVTGMLADEELAALLTHETSPAAFVQVLIKRALEQGGHDNITCVAVYVDEAG